MSNKRYRFTTWKISVVYHFLPLPSSFLLFRFLPGDLSEIFRLLDATFLGNIRHLAHQSLFECANVPHLALIALWLLLSPILRTLSCANRHCDEVLEVVQYKYDVKSDER